MIRFDDRGLVPAVIQDAETGQVLTVAYMNASALQKTLEGPDVWFFSRSRRELWHKGETSGNFLKVREVTADCDHDALLVKVAPAGPACHTGEQSCFHNAVNDSEGESASGPAVLDELFDVIADRRAHPRAGSYTNSLFESGRKRIAQKVIEEAGEAALAGVDDEASRTAEEIADLLYHTLVLMADAGVEPALVWDELRKRRH